MTNWQDLNSLSPYQTMMVKSIVTRACFGGVSGFSSANIFFYIFSLFGSFLVLSFLLSLLDSRVFAPVINQDFFLWKFSFVVIGMQGDVEMLYAYSALWFERFSNQVLPVETRFQPLQPIFQVASHIIHSDMLRDSALDPSGWFLFLVQMHTCAKTYSILSVGKPMLEDFPLAAYDHHNSQIVAFLSFCRV